MNGRCSRLAHASFRGHCSIPEDLVRGSLTGKATWETSFCQVFDRSVMSLSTPSTYYVHSDIPECFTPLSTPVPSGFLTRQTPDAKTASFPSQKGWALLRCSKIADCSQGGKSPDASVCQACHGPREERREGKKKNRGDACVALRLRQLRRGQRVKVTSTLCGITMDGMAGVFVAIYGSL